MKAIIILILLLTGFSGYTQKVTIEEDLEKKYGKFTKRQKVTRMESSLLAKGNGGTYIGHIVYDNKLKSISKKATKVGADFFVYNEEEGYTYDKEKYRPTSYYETSTKSVLVYERYTKKKEKRYHIVYLFRIIPELQKKAREECLFHMIDSTRYYFHSADRKTPQYSLTKKRLQFFVDKGIDFNDIYNKKPHKSFIELFIKSIAGGGYLPRYYTSLSRQKKLELLNLLIKNKVVLTKTNLLNSKRIVNTRIKEIEVRKEGYYNRPGTYRPKKGYVPYLKKVDSLLSTFITK